ncbi:unnamed protein product [Rotaria sordida]|uniref:Nudix hydrolase domain-containing protein n=1 Tax=Rotaria sordida TaxID=392033 RepID=A0A819R4G4_9BILA|nr:unnamed protein product [Rotaria sordida]CAF3732141.1 unnamed protein product [Rotaria sordida]CAF4041090.1 unnamed protein product [Rotaria sordida]
MKHPHYYDLPKGHMEIGESEQQTALRELCEETGIKSSDIDVDSNFRFEYVIIFIILIVVLNMFTQFDFITL